MEHRGACQNVRSASGCFAHRATSGRISSQARQVEYLEKNYGAKTESALSHGAFASGSGIRRHPAPCASIAQAPGPKPFFSRVVGLKGWQGHATPRREKPTRRLFSFHCPPGWAPEHSRIFFGDSCVTGPTSFIRSRESPIFGADPLGQLQESRRLSLVGVRSWKNSGNQYCGH